METNALKNRATQIDADEEASNALPAPPDDNVAGDQVNDHEAAAPAGDAPQVVDHVAEARALIDIVLGIAVPFYPSLDSVYTPEARERLALAAGPLMAKYEVSAGSIFDQYKEEIGFAVVALPLVQPTIAAVKADAAKRGKTPPPASSERASEDSTTDAPSDKGDVQAPMVLS